MSNFIPQIWPPGGNREFRVALALLRWGSEDRNNIHQDFGDSTFSPLCLYSTYKRWGGPSMHFALNLACATCMERLFIPILLVCLFLDHATPYSHMALWLFGYPVWVFMERALKM